MAGHGWRQNPHHLRWGSSKRYIYSHADHHATLRNAHGSLVNQQDVNPVGAIRNSAGSFNIDKQLATPAEVLAREASMAHLSVSKASMNDCLFELVSVLRNS